MPISNPKITRPRPHGAVIRERLFNRIAGASAPVVWISAPPGAGKTTLAASFVETRELPCLWYQVDSGDNDPGTFFYYLGLAAARSGLSRSGPLPLLPSESSTDLAAFSRRYFQTLFERLPPSCVLVLDNYQDATSASFEALSREALSEVPEGMLVVVLSRADPPGSQARLVANRVIAVIDGAELQLTREESDQLALSQTDLDENALASLHDRSGGWAAGLVLMVEHLRRFPPHEDEAIADSQEAVFDYFADQVFSRASPEHQWLLMLTAALPRITVKLAEAISAQGGAEKVLEHLYRRHLFTDRRPGREAVYQFHALFRTFLRGRARANVSAMERSEAASRAGLVLEADGHAEEAVTLYLDAEDWRAAARLILRQANRLYEQGRWRTLLDWIAALPGDVHEAAPWLDYWVGACEVWRSPRSARDRLESTFDRFVESGDRTGQVMSAGALSRACLLDPDWTALDRWIDALESLLDRETESLSARTRLTGFSRLLYATFARQPQHPRLAEWADKALALMLAPDLEANEVVMAGFSLMGYYNWTGSTAKKEHVVRQIQPLLLDTRLSPVTLAYWKFAYAGHVLRTGTPREALAAIDEGLQFATAHGLTIAKVIRRHRVAHLLTLGHLTEAEAELKELESAPRIEPYFELKAWLALQRGELRHAQEEAQTALDMAQDRGRVFYRVFDLILLAIVGVEAGAYDQARAQLAEYRRQTSGVEGRFFQYQALLVDAYIALQAADHDKCLALLRNALEIGEQQHYCGHWGWHPTMMVRLYTVALDQGIAVGYVREAIERHGLLPLSADVEAWPWPVRFYSLGRFEVFIKGEQLRFGGKAQRKPMELARVLIAAGEKGLAETRLIDTLWPDRLEIDGQKTFDITVHRLRKLLGSDMAVKVTDRTAALDPQVVWVDAWSLERMLARLTPPLAGAEPAIGLLEAAAPQVLRLYGGAFLAGEADTPWQLPVRNRLTGRFQRFVSRVGAHWEAQREWNRAAALYERAVELDPLAESFYRQQMICLQAQGRRAEALDVFRRCRQTLSVTLGVAPTSETDQIYRQLLVS